ncbi:UPF0223 family protein [Bacillus sp. DJP31]|uniref:UPF0223 family protein n=1 Tax=Bacillus sp. DJP31 TaxID=3409789 RepID=UPI003BB699B5
MSYHYPISTDWKTNEIVDVVNFFSCIETAYEKGIERDKLIQAYQRFKAIVTSKSEEKSICGDFEDESGYSCYKTMKKAKEETTTKIIKMR